MGGTASAPGTTDGRTLAGPVDLPTSTPLPPSTAGRWIGFFRGHPIVCLAILTPGIPEYLSTSSPLLNLVVNPAGFLLGLAINVAQYTGGALLVREAWVRWRLGWPGVTALALAYGVTEEGLGDNTLFNSTGHVDGILGHYGRFAGVNWVWSVGVLAFHVICSIGIPIVILGLALPATRGRSLLGPRGVAAAFAAVAASTGLETAIVWGSDRFWMGAPLLVGALVVIAVLVAVARFLPRDVGAPTGVQPTLGPRTAAAIGFSVFPVLFVLEYGVGPLGVPSAALIGIELAVLLLFIELGRRSIGRQDHDRVLVDLSFGFVLWVAVFGVLLTVGLPYTLPLVGVAVLFFVRLRRTYGPVVPTPGGSST
ncbi:MAG TPA: hypothetical protein VML53_01815 [Thermoplasmata archaeon]|nr:hypothetical protein [Thermoplasmata archaeon]